MVIYGAVERINIIKIIFSLYLLVLLNNYICWCSNNFVQQRNSRFLVNSYCIFNSTQMKLLSIIYAQIITIFINIITTVMNK